MLAATGTLFGVFLLVNMRADLETGLGVTAARAGTGTTLLALLLAAGAGLLVLRGLRTRWYVRLLGNEKSPGDEARVPAYQAQLALPKHPYWGWQVSAWAIFSAGLLLLAGVVFLTGGESAASTGIALLFGGGLLALSHVMRRGVRALQ